MSGIEDGTDRERYLAGHVDPVSPKAAREYADYWVQIYGLGTQRKGIHVPGDDSSRDAPTTLCSRPGLKDGKRVDKDLETYPEGYDPDRICKSCREVLARRRDGDGGDPGVE